MEKMALNRVIHESPYKLRYVLAQVDMNESTYWRRLRDQNFRISEKEKFARILNVPMDSIDFKKGEKI